MNDERLAEIRAQRRELHERVTSGREVHQASLLLLYAEHTNDLLAHLDAERSRADALEVQVAELRAAGIEMQNALLACRFPAGESSETVDAQAKAALNRARDILVTDSPTRGAAIVEAAERMRVLLRVWGALIESDIEAMERVPEDIRDAEYHEDLKAMEDRLAEVTGAETAYRALGVGRAGGGEERESA
jgi:hypothetical protein